MTNSFFYFALVPISMLAFTAADNLPTPPVAKKIPHVTEINGYKMTDSYFWLREKTNPAVMAHLQAENDYADSLMKRTSEQRPRSCSTSVRLAGLSST